jgi:hypothetical protein
MSISSSSVTDYIKCMFGSDGLLAIQNAAHALSAIDKKIELTFRIINDDFLIVNSKTAKKEQLAKALDEVHYELWKPILSDKTDKEGNFIIELQPTQKAIEEVQRLKALMELFIKAYPPASDKK